MEQLTWPVTIRNPDNQRQETIDAWYDGRPGFAVFPGIVMRRMGIEPGLPLTITEPDGTLVVKDSRSLHLSIQGQTGRGVVIFGDNEESPKITNITLFGMGLKLDPAENRLVKRLPRTKPPWWYEHQRKLKEAIERIEAERRGGLISSGGE